MYLSDSSDNEYYDDLLETAEQGMSKSLLPDELYMPGHRSRGWIKCFISSTGPETFRLYLEGKKRVRFLLSAKKFPNDPNIYISTSEDFPMLDYPLKNSYIGYIEKQKDNSHLVFLTHCRLCDYTLSKPSCGRGEDIKEVIARIQYNLRYYRELSLYFRVVYVSLPGLYQSGNRKIWCPRAFELLKNNKNKNKNKKKSYNNIINNNNDYDFDLNDLNSCIKNYYDGKINIESVLPEWNDSLGGLIVRFQGNRILSASAKNFLLSPSIPSATLSTNSSNIPYKYGNVINSDHKPSLIRSFSDEDLSNTNTNESTNIDTEPLSPSPNTLKNSTYALIETQTPLTKKKLIMEKLSSQIINSNNSNTSSAPIPIDRHSRTESIDSLSGSLTTNYDIQSFSPSSASPILSNFKEFKEICISSNSSVSSSSSISSSISGLPKNKQPIQLDPSQPIFQFGKITSNRYALDFRFPLSPIQAFGIALSSFNDDLSREQKLNGNNNSSNNNNSVSSQSFSSSDLYKVLNCQY